MRADVRDPASLKAALRGASTVISAITGFGGPDAGGANAVDRDGNVALVAAASGEGVRRFVLLSVLGAAADSPVALFRAKHAAEQALLATTMEAAIVRPTAYVETWLEIVGRPLAEPGSTRVFGRGRNPVNFVSADDVAAVVVALATGPAPANPAVTLAGPEDLTLDELAALCRARDRRRATDRAHAARDDAPPGHGPRCRAAGLRGPAPRGAAHGWGGHAGERRRSPIAVSPGAGHDG